DGIAGLADLDRGAALVGGRPKRLLDEELGDRVAVARRIEDEEIDRADVAAGLHGWADRQDGATHDLPTSLGDEDARVREEDELAEHVSGVELADAGRPQRLAAKRDEAVDVRDPGCSRRVVHPLGVLLDRKAPIHAGVRHRSGVSVCRYRTFPGANDRLAIGALSPIIRHRFGGYLRAVRRLFPRRRRRAPPSASPTPSTPSGPATVGPADPGADCGSRAAFRVSCW